MDIMQLRIGKTFLFEFLDTNKRRIVRTGTIILFLARQRNLSLTVHYAKNLFVQFYYTNEKTVRVQDNRTFF